MARVNVEEKRRKARTIVRHAQCAIQHNIACSGAM